MIWLDYLEDVVPVDVNVYDVNVIDELGIEVF